MELDADPDFKIIGCADIIQDSILRPRVDYWKQSLQRFCGNPVALSAAVLLLGIVFLTIAGPRLNSYSAEALDLAIRNQGPDRFHWFGTDQLGRDVFTRVWLGGRASIIIGILGSIIVTVIGCVYGGIASYFGGVVDLVMMRIAEIIDSVPYLLVVIIISLVMDSTSIPVLLFSMTLTAWCSTARIVRAQMLQINSMEYIMAARVMAVPSLQIIFRHFIPNSLSVIIVSLTFRIPGFIFSEAFLSYVGLGVRPPVTSWGALCSAATGTLQFYPYQMFFPALCIAVTMLCFTLIGDGLRDALDPKLRR